MTDKTQEILNLAEERSNNYRAYLSTSLALNDSVLDRLDEVEPLEGEVWYVIPLRKEFNPAVVTATKLMVGWEINPTYIDPGDSDDNLVATSHCYPVERIAEAPTLGGGECPI